MTETTAQKLSPKMKDDLGKAADIIADGFRFTHTHSGYDYWDTVCTKLRELSGVIPETPFTTPGEVGTGDPELEGCNYSGKWIGAWKDLSAAAIAIANMDWDETSSEFYYWHDVYRRLHSLTVRAAEEQGSATVTVAAKKQSETVKKAKEASQPPSPTPGPMTLCVCHHAYHTHSKKHGCKFRGKDECFRFRYAPGGVGIKPLAVPSISPSEKYGGVEL